MNSVKSTILIVDDELSIRKLLAFYLGKNYNVIVKDDAYEALNWLQSGNKPDAIIADIEMPVFSGKDLLLSIKSKKRLTNIPFIMISGSDEDSNKIECLRLGADDFFVKPLRPCQIETSLLNLINRFKSIIN